MRALRAWLVLAAFFAFTFPLMPLQLLFLRTGSRYARTFPNWYHRQVCRLVGIRLHIDGGVAREQGVLLISNHVSWLDITVLSAVAPVSFVAKQEVASWPFVSWLAKLQRSVFVDRTRRSEVDRQGERDSAPARSRRSRRAVRRRHLERRQQRGAVQDAAVCRGQADGRRSRSGRPLRPDLGADLHQAARASALPPRAARGCLVRRHGPGEPRLAAAWASARSTRISASGRRCRSTISPTARRSRAMPRTRSAMTWPSFCAAAVSPNRAEARSPA